MEIALYAMPSGKEPVREWLLALDEESHGILGREDAEDTKADLDLAKKRAKEMA